MTLVREVLKGKCRQRKDGLRVFVFFSSFRIIIIILSKEKNLDYSAANGLDSSITILILPVLNYLATKPSRICIPGVSCISVEPKPVSGFRTYWTNLSKRKEPESLLLSKTHKLSLSSALFGVRNWTKSRSLKWFIEYPETKHTLLLNCSTLNKQFMNNWECESTLLLVQEVGHVLGTTGFFSRMWRICPGALGSLWPNNWDTHSGFYQYLFHSLEGRLVINSGWRFKYKSPQTQKTKNQTACTSYFVLYLQ